MERADFDLFDEDGLDRLIEAGISLGIIVLPCPVQLIIPYRDAGVWLVDDSSRGLHRGPILLGDSAYLDEMVRDLPGSNEGFALYFSSEVLLGFQVKLVRVEMPVGNHGGVYVDSRTGQRITVCKAIARYFDQSPKNIYIRAEQFLR